MVEPKMMDLIEALVHKLSVPRKHAINVVETDEMVRLLETISSNQKKAAAPDEDWLSMIRKPAPPHKEWLEVIRKANIALRELYPTIPQADIFVYKKNTWCVRITGQWRERLRNTNLKCFLEDAADPQTQRQEEHRRHHQQLEQCQQQEQRQHQREDDRSHQCGGGAAGAMELECSKKIIALDASDIGRHGEHRLSGEAHPNVNCEKIFAACDHYLDQGLEVRVYIKPWATREEWYQDDMTRFMTRLDGKPDCQVIVDPDGRAMARLAMEYPCALVVTNDNMLFDDIIKEGYFSKIRAQQLTTGYHFGGAGGKPCFRPWRRSEGRWVPREDNQSRQGGAGAAEAMELECSKKIIALDALNIGRHGEPRLSGEDPNVNFEKIFAACDHYLDQGLEVRVYIKPWGLQMKEKWYQDIMIRLGGKPDCQLIVCDHRYSGGKSRDDRAMAQVAIEYPCALVVTNDNRLFDDIIKQGYFSEDRARRQTRNYYFDGAGGKPRFYPLL